MKNKIPVCVSVLLNGFQWGQGSVILLKSRARSKGLSTSFIILQQPLKIIVVQRQAWVVLALYEH